MIQHPWFVLFTFVTIVAWIYVSDLSRRLKGKNVELIATYRARQRDPSIPNDDLVTFAQTRITPLRKRRNWMILVAAISTLTALALAPWWIS